MTQETLKEVVIASHNVIPDATDYLEFAVIALVMLIVVLIVRKTP